MHDRGEVQFVAAQAASKQEELDVDNFRDQVRQTVEEECI
jgi:hypothetical protein